MNATKAIRQIDLLQIEVNMNCELNTYLSHTLFFQRDQPSTTAAGRLNLPHVPESCFMAVVLQALFSVSGFLEGGGRIKQRLQKMLEACQSFDSPYWSVRASADLLEFYRTEVRTMVALKIGKERLFKLGDQGDPIQFFDELLSLNGISEATRALFQCQIKTDIWCLTCGFKSKNVYEKTNYITLETSGKRSSLQDILANYVEQETFTHHFPWCQTCSKGKESMCRQKIVLPGEALVVTLQGSTQCKTVVTAGFEISFCGHQYFLAAQVKRIGNEKTKGHFVLDARGLRDVSLSGSFFHLDDLESKAPGQSQDNFNESSTSVMFFYRRKVTDEVTGLLLHMLSNYYEYLLCIPPRPLICLLILQLARWRSQQQHQINYL